MKQDHAQAITDLIVVGLGAVAAVYVIKTPPLRRAAGRAMKYLLVSALPRLVWRETKHAWQLSSRRSGIAD